MFLSTFYYNYWFIIFSIPKESILDIKGTVQEVPKPIESCTQSNVELACEEIWVVSLSEPRLPLQIDDASRPVTGEEVRNRLFV